MSKHVVFSPSERALSFLAGLVNLVVGLGFFFLPEIHSLLWPTSIPPRVKNQAELVLSIDKYLLRSGKASCVWESQSKYTLRLRSQFHEEISLFPQYFPKHLPAAISTFLATSHELIRNLTLRFASRRSCFQLSEGSLILLKEKARAVDNLL